MNKNPNHRKNGGKGTFFGNLLRTALSLGKKFSPVLINLIENATGIDDIDSIKSQLEKEDFTEGELNLLKQELEQDAIELQEITKRWEADMKSESWLAKNVRPATLVLYNLATITFIALDSYVPGFEVNSMWINILISNTGIVNTAYFGSRYLEKKDKLKH